MPLNPTFKITALHYYVNEHHRNVRIKTHNHKQHSSLYKEAAQWVASSADFQSAGSVKTGASLFAVVKPKTGLNYNLLMCHGITS